MIRLIKINRLIINTVFFIIVATVQLSANQQADFVMDKNKDGKSDQWYFREGTEIRRIEMDSNFDGVIDSLTFYDEKGQKEKEEYDFNFDGKMDDFYFFENGVLIRREIDSNYDDAIDIWVFLTKGIYVKRMEQDKDFDGKVDYIKEY